MWLRKSKKNAWKKRNWKRPERRNKNSRARHSAFLARMLKKLKSQPGRNSFFDLDS